MRDKGNTATLFQYRYRDAGNFKASGLVVLEGQLTAAEQQRFRRCLDRGEFFVAEQVAVPPLYGQLYQWSGGPTSSDHCWHEFVGFAEADSSDAPPDSFYWGKAADFLGRFCSIEEWDGSLSPHFGIRA